MFSLEKILFLLSKLTFSALNSRFSIFRDTLPSSDKNSFFVSKKVLSALNSRLEAAKLPKYKVLRKIILNILFKNSILPLKKIILEIYRILILFKIILFNRKFYEQINK